MLPFKLNTSSIQTRSRVKVFLFGSPRTSSSNCCCSSPNTVSEVTCHLPVLVLASRSSLQVHAGLFHEVGQTPRTMKPRCSEGASSPAASSLPAPNPRHHGAGAKVPPAQGPCWAPQEGPQQRHPPHAAPARFCSKAAAAGLHFPAGFTDGGRGGKMEKVFPPFFLPHHILSQ